MARLKDIGKFFMLFVSGLVAIVVGSFMLRGIMRLWDKPTDSDDASI